MLPELCGRFCAKEAVQGSLVQASQRGISFLDIEIVNDDKGKPVVNLSGKALLRYGNMGARAIDISLTHCRDYVPCSGCDSNRE